MKTIFATLLIIGFLINVLTLQSNTVEISGLTFILPNLSLKIKIFLAAFYIFIILLFVFLTIQDIKDEQIDNIYLRIYREYFLQYIKSNNGQKIDDLTILFPQLDSSTDISYLDNTLVLKTSNVFNDGSYQPPGYILNIKKIQYNWLKIKFHLKTALSLKIIPYTGLLMLTLINLLFFILSLVCKAHDFYLITAQ
ncbi:hypothetical protein Lgra_3115 [Legionella gratiana]|uniref:Transmembrane protein n=1 Tax=Legionella gratiana TaxID=45066 RepID=A0A378J6Q7_9GAMM|nr:hypothetical protein [Legionella gratiana]KTD06338.1 hypothetical protein Lgra_3115 [Legionella gratiana]STX43463.1 Uncharacterised protein [Legionella gratiana]